MKPERPGQQWINEVERTVENSPRPIGMPPLEAISSEVMRLGYTKEDAASIFDFWLSNGFRTGRNKIRDWRAAIRVMIRFRRLPSQKTDPPGLIEHKTYKPAQLREAQRDRLKGKEATDEERKQLGHAFRKWRRDNL